MRSARSFAPGRRSACNPTAPFFIDKVRDIVGLYRNPPERAIILSVEEKSPVQARDRTQPLWPLGPGQAERHTHAYVRNGTPSWFAAWNVATGAVWGPCYRKHRQQEFRHFLPRIDEADPAPEGVELPLILDNYGTPKTPKVKRWLQRRPRFVVPFTPTSAAWLYPVERFFAAITAKRLRRGAFRHLRALEQAIQDSWDNPHQAPQPFVWTATAELLFSKVEMNWKQISNSGHYCIVTAKKTAWRFRANRRFCVAQRGVPCGSCTSFA